MSSPATRCGPGTVTRHGDGGFGLSVVVGVPGRPDRSGQPGEREGVAVQQAADEVTAAGRGSSRVRHERPWAAAIEFTRERHHIKDWVTLPIEQLGEVWGQQLIPKIPALTLLRYPARVQLMSAKK